MTIRTGDMFDELSHASPRPGLLLFTGNSTVNAKGELVQGRGAALQARALFPGLSKRLGHRLTQWKDTIHSPVYGVLTDQTSSNPILGVFQVKFHYSAPAQVHLIENSVQALLRWLADVPADFVTWMNFPGIGYGQLPRKTVLPLISILPDNVHIWEKP